MGAINGFIYRNQDVSQAEILLEKMNLSKIDAQNRDLFFIENAQNSTIAFAQKQSGGNHTDVHQSPIFTEDKSKIIIFDGEIYNTQELKNILAPKNYHPSSDAGIVLNLYECFGTEAFKMIDGVFAFSIYDKGLGKVFIARDFFGDRPLHYQYSEKGLVWATELRSLIVILDKKPEIDKQGLNLYFQLTYIPAPFTIYEGIKKLEPNQFMVFDVASNTFDIYPIHTDHIVKQDISFDEARNHVRDLVEQSVASRMGTGSLGAFLSGGVDSSIVSLCLSRASSEKINTFSIGFDKKSFDETEKSRLVAKLIGSNHNEFIISEKDLSADLDKILLHFDEPFADSSALPSYIVASKSKTFVDAALTGDGGDEVFGGYNKYLIGGINQKYTSIVPRFLHQGILKITSPLTKQKGDQRGLKFKIRKTLDSIDYDDAFFYNIIKLGFSNRDILAYFNENKVVENALSYYQAKIPNPKTLTDFRNVDKMISLEGDMIVKVERTSMLAGLKCRAPLLTRKIWNYSLSLPDEYLLKGNYKKIILKKAFEKDFPAQFLEKSKQGFGVPVGDWLRQGMKNELLSYIEEPFLEKQNIFNIPNIRKIILNHISAVEDNSFKVWTFYCFQKWYKNTYLS